MLNTALFFSEQFCFGYKAEEKKTQCDTYTHRNYNLNPNENKQ